MTQDQKKATSLYIVFIAGAALQCVPVFQLQVISLLMLATLLIALPLIRNRADPGSALQQHSLYLNRTLWAWSLLLLVGMAAGGYMVAQEYTYDQITQVVLSLSHFDANNMSPDARRFIVLSVQAVLPAMVYLVYRLGRGVTLLLAGKPFRNPKTFL